MRTDSPTMVSQVLTLSLSAVAAREIIEWRVCTLSVTRLFSPQDIPNVCRELGIQIQNKHRCVVGLESPRPDAAIQTLCKLAFELAV